MAGLHITFTNGSNPWLMYSDSDRKIQNAIRRWKRNFRIVDRYEENDNIYLTITEKTGEEKYVMKEKNKEMYLRGKASARDKAIEWQLETMEMSLSYEVLMIAQNYFQKLGKRYGLLTEFRENGIC